MYNKEFSVAKTLTSLQNQVFKEFEVVIVNDGSTDSSLKVVKGFNDNRIRIINQENGGVSSARNRGIKEANFEWITFLDADDLWCENHLSVFYNLIHKYPKQSVFANGFIKSKAQHLEIVMDEPILVEDYFEETYKEPFFWTSATCINKDVFNHVGVFNELLNRGEDLELWTRIGRKYSFVKSNIVTAIYRIEAENRSDKNFVLEKSRVYNYEFIPEISESEKVYYRREIVNSILSSLRNRDFQNAHKLFKKHQSIRLYHLIIGGFKIIIKSLNKS